MTVETTPLDAAPFQHCLVAGAGSWGTALAVLLASAGRQVTVWSRSEETAAAINDQRCNPRYLKDVVMPEGVLATTDPSVIASVDAVVMVVPAQYARPALGQLKAHAGGRALPVLLCSKGIERGTGLLMHQMLSDAWPEAQGAVLSGPSFAADVASGLPTAVTLADSDGPRAQRWIATCATRAFRPYATDDVLGVELGGAIKNVLAIACGVVEGRNLGESAKAAIMARGFAEALRFAAARGANAETLMGLSGLGDIILTCSSRQSRNMALGFAIGEGQRVSTYLEGQVTVAEGASTAPVLDQLARETGVDMPLCSVVAALVQDKITVDDAINALLSRPLKHEVGN